MKKNLSPLIAEPKAIEKLETLVRGPVPNTIYTEAYVTTLAKFFYLWAWPVPKEPFSLYIRCYWPDEAILEDKWTPPPVVKK